MAALFGSLGSFVFWLLGAPLPFMLGALTASAAVAIAGMPWAIPRQFRDFVRPVIGVLAGSTFTPAILAQAGQWVGIMFLIAAFSVISTLCGYLLFRHLGKFDPATAFFASTPAGLSEMSMLGDSFGGSLRTMFLVHTVRIIAVVFLVPLIIQFVTGSDVGRQPVTQVHPNVASADWFLLVLCGVAGFILGKFSTMPGGIMIFSLVLSAVAHLSGLTTAAPPPWVVVGVQIVIGCVAGARFAGIQWSEVRTTLAIGALWAALLISAVTLTAYLATQIYAFSLSTLLLALAPGGMIEMTLITYALGIDVAFVVTCQVLRNFCTLLLAPLVFRYISYSKSA